MANGFGYGAGVNPAVAAAGCGAVSPVSAVSPFSCMMNNGFLLLLLLFILLASCATMGREKNFFFIIILAVIAFGGFGRTFGFGGGAAPVY